MAERREGGGRGERGDTRFTFGTVLPTDDPCC